MASTVYDSARQAFAGGLLGWTTLDFRAILVDTADYTLDAANHEFLSDVPLAARVATSTALAGKSRTGGILDASDVLFPSVSGDSVEAVIIYQHTGVEGTSRLVVYLDESSAGLPVSPNGGNITIQWDATGIVSFQGPNWYNWGLEQLTGGSVDWVADDIRAILIDTASYAVDLGADQVLSQVPAGARIATAQVTGRTNVGGLLDANDVLWPAVPTSPTSEAVIVYLDTGVEVGSPLLAYRDSGIVGSPVTPDGFDITLAWGSPSALTF